MKVAFSLLGDSIALGLLTTLKTLELIQSLTFLYFNKMKTGECLTFEMKTYEPLNFVFGHNDTGNDV